jgi:hypothetical protein
VSAASRCPLDVDLGRPIGVPLMAEIGAPSPFRHALGEGPLTTQLSRSRRVLRTAGVGHLERFPSPRLNARFAFSEETFARHHGNGKDAPIPAVRRTTIGRLKSTLTGRAGLLQRAFASARKWAFGFARRAADAHRRLACRAEAAAATAADGAYLQHR